MSRPSKFSAETRERAVRMVHEQWASPSFIDTPDPQNEACSNASGLTPPRWL
jgi:hypothetical protein